MLVLLWLACRNPERAEEARELAVQVAMSDHAAHGAAVRDAVIRGDLPSATKSAHKLAAALPPKELPPDAGSASAAFLAAVTAVEEATDIASAARATGRMAQACGACHTAMSVSPPLLLGPPPAASNGVPASEMAVHQWAVEGLWIGLVRPSDADLATAAATLSTATLSFDQRGGELTQAAHELDAAVHAAAGQVSTATGDERGEAYGRLLTTCATCHLVRPGGL